MASKHPRQDATPITSKKRKADSAASNGPSSNGRNGAAAQQKRAKVRSLRTIPAQPADAALKDGQLDIQAFVAAHEFEIKALEQSMATSKTAGSNRAFQQVPRGLRRRTASHNPRRVPKRLRSRAKREMAEDNTPIVEARRTKPRTTRARIRAETAKKLRVLAGRKRRKREANAKKAREDDSAAAKPEGNKKQLMGRKPRPKIRRNQLNDPMRPPAKFRKRQIHKSWLPTHLWHAKRARMTPPKEPLWGFAVPLTTNEKIYRSSHRAQGERGALVWDMSYMSTVGVYGHEAGLGRVLRKLGVPESCWMEKGRRWRLGSRTWSGPLTRETKTGRHFVSPAMILWDPLPLPSPMQPAPDHDQEKSRRRQVYLRLHPSAFLEVFKELLRLIKMETPKLYIEDLRYEIGSLELSGPASTETLLSVLKPYITKKSPKSKQASIFESLKPLTNPASLPANAILAFEVQDPRLRHPPRKLDVDFDERDEEQLLETISQWPVDEDLKKHALFDRDVRHRASFLPHQKAIDRRRRTAGPEGLLKPTDKDPPIPVILLASRSGTGVQTQGSWTLLAPWKCILPIWYSIVRLPLSSGGNPQFAGVNEQRQVAFERGLPWFPADFIAASAGAQWELEERGKRRRAWEKRPKSKRTHWEALDLGAGRKGELGDGLACDFEMLFGWQVESSKPAETSDDSMDVDGDGDEGSKARDMPSDPLTLLNHVSKDVFNKLADGSAPTPAPPPSPAGSIIMVRLTLMSRGVARPCARIYRLPSVPRTEPPSTDIEVPATIPPGTCSGPLPLALRTQWLSRADSLRNRRSDTAKLAARSSSSSSSSSSSDLATRRQALAQELTSTQPATGHPTTTSPAAGKASGIDGHHPLVPDAQDLVGFVTTGAFCLSEGRGVAFGSIAVDKVVPGCRDNAREGRLCVVRNAGEDVGWLARWEVL